MHTLRRGILGLACALWLPACTAPGETPRPRNLILISIDTLRADHLGCYGYARPTSPEIDRIAAAGLVFGDASAPSPWTKPSHASLFTGLYPSRNGGDTMVSRLSEEVETLAERFAAAGFRTAAVVNSRWLTMHGLERGFAEFFAVDYVQGRRESSPVTERALDWLARREREWPFFLFVHYMDVHSDYTSLPRYEQLFARPYDGPVDGSTRQLYAIAEGRMRLDERDVGRLIDLYDAGIRQVDDDLGRLLARLREQGLLDESLLVITADHGEEFLEHGSVLHGHTQYQEVLQVPLIFHGPGIPAGRRLAEPVSLIDVAPTCLELLGLDAPRGLDGVALHGLWHTPPAALTPRELFYEADVTFPPPAPGAVPPGPHRAVRDARHKLHLDLETGQVALFDLDSDPRERIDVHVEREETGKALYRRWLYHAAAARERREAGELTDEQLRELRSLGYVGGN